MKGYVPQIRRINPELGWAEWADTSKHPAAFDRREFDDSNWHDASIQRIEIGNPAPSSIGEVRADIRVIEPIAKGELTEVYGYERDDPPVRFFLRDLTGHAAPPQGVWRRYDLGRVRLGRVWITLEVPIGAVVECAYSEALHNNRVTPWISLSLGPSCNLDHYVAAGGMQKFASVAPRGGRFVEVHVLAPPAQVRFLREEYCERTYHGPAQGSFESKDELLNRIWTTGVDTYRACSEDAVIDNPTRERGQWAGDLAVALEIAAVAYSDLRLFRRGLMQCAQCAREDGMVAGLCPGTRTFLTTYAAQWVSACIRYWELTGDRDFLRSLFPAAQANVAAFEKWLTPHGVSDQTGWGFVDWGYVRNEGPVDIAVNLHLSRALSDMVRWSAVLDDGAARRRFTALSDMLGAAIAHWLSDKTWRTIGFHRTVLALRAGHHCSESDAAAVPVLKRHISSCFPADGGRSSFERPGSR